MKIELFKPIPNYEGRYEVSNRGRVKSTIYRTPKILKTPKDVYGYQRVHLRKDNRSKNTCVHRLVAKAFLNHTFKNYNLVIDHIDGNKSNNNLNNLQLISQRENSIKAGRSRNYLKGVVKRGKTFMARMSYQKKSLCLGHYHTEIEAHQKYLKYSQIADSDLFSIDQLKELIKIDKHIKKC